MEEKKKRQWDFAAIIREYETYHGNIGLKKFCEMHRCFLVSMLLGVHYHRTVTEIVTVLGFEVKFSRESIWI